MCLQPISVPRYGSFDNVLYYDTVPCGKCYECLRARQSGYRVRCFIEALKSNNVCFATFTYSPKSVPVFYRECVTYANGTRIYSDLVDIDFFEDLKKYRSDYVSRTLFVHGVRVSDCRPLDLPASIDVDESGEEISVSPQICASLRNADVQKCFKRARQSYKRKYGCNPPEFKYLAVGEYGSLSGRPHYHILFFNPDHEFLTSYLFPDWESHFGYVDKAYVKCHMEDFSKVSTYISKYVTKGGFDQPYVRTGCCAVPRIMVSSFLGSLSKDEETRLKCQDIYPHIARDLDFVMDDFNNPFKRNSVFNDHCKDSPVVHQPYDTDNIFNFILYKNRVDPCFFTPEIVSLLMMHFDSCGYTSICERMISRRKKLIGDFSSNYGSYYQRVYIDNFIKTTDDYGNVSLKVVHPPSQTAFAAYKTLRYYKLHFDELEELQVSGLACSLFEAQLVSQSLHEKQLETRSATSYQSLKSFYQKTQFN